MSITAANAVFMFSVPLLFPVPQQLQGFAADDIFSMDPVETTEVLMGVDGVLSAGFVFVPYKQSISLQADSPSNAIFDAWQAASLTAKDTFAAVGVVTLKGIKTTWALGNGYLTSYPPIPDAGKILKPRKFGVTWGTLSPAVTGP